MKNKDTLKRGFSATFLSQSIFSSLKNHSKSLKKVAPEKPLRNPKLIPNSHCRNTSIFNHFNRFLTFFNLKEYYGNKYLVGVNLKYFYVIFVLSF